MLAANIVAALDAQPQPKAWMKRQSAWRSWRTSGIAKPITMSCWERVATEEKQGRALEKIGFASGGKVSDRRKDEKEPRINADYADILRTSQALAFSFHAVGVVRFVVDQLNLIIAEIEDQAVKLDLEPFKKHFQVAVLRPILWLGVPAFEFFFKQ